ncbi:hypothetical protein [Curtobacterium luteum]|uniref:hypothetical protein n=1 Tax=Curtobacterium luteum TaxID=33881 RepID=UPI00128F3482|nr:hypothetical protein [Curtobacterium luteum]
MTNSLLQNPAPATDAARRPLTLAFENLLAATLEESAPRQPKDIGQIRDGLFMAAQAVIETEFRDPAFIVERLARELAVSENTFKQMGTAPAARSDAAASPKLRTSRRRSP